MLTAHICAAGPGLVLQVLGSERDMLRTLLDDEVDVVVAAPQIDHPICSLVGLAQACHGVWFMGLRCLRRAR